MTDYCSISDLKTDLGINDAAEDALLAVCVSAATTQIDDWCGRFFYQDATLQTRLYRADNSLSLYVHDISTTTGLVVQIDIADVGTYDTTLVIGTDFQVAPYNAAQDTPVHPFTELEIVAGTSAFWPRGSRPCVKVTAKFGWPAIPAAVSRAARVLAIDLYKVKDAPFGLAGGNDFGPLRVQPGINRTAAMLLAPYRKHQIG